MTFEAPQQAFFLPIYRAWELLVGAIIAFGGIPKPSAFVARIARLVGLAACCILSIYTISRAGGFAALLGGRPGDLGRIGLISYPLYLWHWPVLVFAGYALRSAPTPAETAGLILLSFALAWA
jgi:peptidoglycan/LPS O-acetylase OafA/YrhL